VQSKINSKNSQKTVQKHFSNEMKIHFFIEDTHLPPKISHLITRTANEKPREQNSQSVMILVVRLGQLTNWFTQYIEVQTGSRTRDLSHMATPPEPNPLLQK
jgi:hypothetical protein